MQAQHKAPQPAARARESGFIISVELLLFFTILCIGSIAGCVAIRDALTERAAVRAVLSFYIHDSADPQNVIGVPRDFNTCGVPRVFGRDPADGAGLLLGIKPYQFESRGRVYFSGCDCTTTGETTSGGGSGNFVPGPGFAGGGPWVASPTDDGTGPGGITRPNDILAISFLESLQGASFAVGPDFDGDPANPLEGQPGLLYRGDGVDFSEAPVRSMFVSQGLTDARPGFSVDTADPETACGVFEHDDDWFESEGKIITPSEGSAGPATPAMGHCYNLDPICEHPDISGATFANCNSSGPPVPPNPPEGDDAACPGSNFFWSACVDESDASSGCAQCVAGNFDPATGACCASGDCSADISAGSGVIVPALYLQLAAEVPKRDSDGAIIPDTNLLEGFTLPFVVDLPTAPTRTRFAPGANEGDHPALDAIP